MSLLLHHSKAKMQVIVKWFQLVTLEGNNTIAILIQSKKQYDKSNLVVIRVSRTLACKLPT